MLQYRRNILPRSNQIRRLFTLLSSDFNLSERINRFRRCGGSVTAAREKEAEGRGRFHFSLRARKKESRDPFWSFANFRGRCSIRRVLHGPLPPSTVSALNSGAFPRFYSRSSFTLHPVHRRQREGEKKKGRKGKRERSIDASSPARRRRVVGRTTGRKENRKRLPLPLRAEIQTG